MHVDANILLNRRSSRHSPIGASWQNLGRCDPQLQVAGIRSPHSAGDRGPEILCWAAQAIQRQVPLRFAFRGYHRGILQE